MEQHYQQVQCTAMGSPVSVVVADMVMETAEQNALETFPADLGSGRGMLMIH